MAELTFEDFTPGTRFALGPYAVTRDAVLDFARAYDPQPFHLDEEAAKASILGGLSASGWHTCCMMMRMMFDGYLGRSTSQGASHVEYIRWLRPVRPGDRLTGTSTVEAARLSASRPGLGMATISTELANEAGEAVLSGRYLLFVLAEGASPEPAPERAPPAAPATPPLPETDAAPREVGRATRFFETFQTGDEDLLGHHIFDEKDIVTFARDYDPQYFHLDRERARHSLLGGLCASGWHVAAAMMRLLVETNDRHGRAWAAVHGGVPPRFGPSPGTRDLRWLAPVRPGDTLSYTRRITDKRVTQSRPGWGVVETAIEARNQKNVLVFTMQAAAFIGTD